MASGRASAERGGAGLSALDGVLRLDVARGLSPVAQWRVSVYLDGTL
ncbi:MAG TPA: hypothetical protein VMH39_14345 [Gemmatimonadaceae bacterium]|nr:hypothetical protein [Gemmatimonadaceae bacterium]